MLNATRPTDQSAIDPKVPLTIGYLSSYLSSKMTLGAIPLAIETINNDPNLLPGRKLQFVAADIGNPGMHALLKLIAQNIDSSTQL